MSDVRMEIITSMNYSNTDDIMSDMKHIIDAARSQTYQAVNSALVKRNNSRKKKKEDCNYSGRNTHLLRVS